MRKYKIVYLFNLVVRFVVNLIVEVHYFYNA